MNKKKNNKGFSLVELIVVIAVMAVLVVVLAPAYLRYVDKARVQKDVSAISEVVNAIKIAAAEEAVSEEFTADTVVTIGKDGTIAVDGVTLGKDASGADETLTTCNLYKEITATVGTSINLSSSTFTASDADDIEIGVVKNANNHSLTFTITGPEQAKLDTIEK